MKVVCVFIALLNGFGLFASNAINYTPLMTAHIIKTKVLGGDNFFILDVGASGGVGSFWKVLEPHLQAVGFDPLVNEVERLNRTNPNPKIKYLSYFIVSEKKEIDEYMAADVSNVWGRSSAPAYERAFNLNYQKEVFNSGQEFVFTDQKISLDRFCLENDVKTVDFIKTDTDGYDFKVLCGAEHLLEDQATLGLLVECMYVANLHPFSNAFRNVDSLLVGAGFTLFDLSVVSYTKKDLPGKFLYRIPAQTNRGQVCWGDVLYLRDFVRMKNEGKQVPTQQLIKMACIQEIFGLPDCAAELLITFRDQLSSVINVDYYLDLLTQDMNLYPTYRSHIHQFNNNPTAFFP